MFRMTKVARGLPSWGTPSGDPPAPERYALYRGQAIRFVFSSPEPCALAVMNECPRSGGAAEEISS